MSHNCTPVTSEKKERVFTKREVLIKLYQEMQIEINKIIDLGYIFPKIEDTDFADIIFNISWLFPSGADVKTTIKQLMKDTSFINNITYTDSQFSEVSKIIEKFLYQYYSI